MAKRKVLLDYPHQVKRTGSGRLAELPLAYFDPKVHRPFTAEDFASPALWLRWQAFLKRQRAADLVAEAGVLDDRADLMEEYDDEEERKMALRLRTLERERESLAAELERRKAMPREQRPVEQEDDS